MNNAKPKTPRRPRGPKTLRLQSGLLLTDPAGMLRQKFEQWPWDNYDGHTPAHPNQVTLRDVEIANVGLGARAPYRQWEQLIQANDRQINVNDLLGQLPADTPLEDVDLACLKDPLIQLFDLVHGPHISISRASKVLFLFRPKLLAVLDSVVENYYWYATSITNEDRFRRLERAATWGKYAFELLALLRDDVRCARDTIDEIRNAVRPEPYSHASRVRVVESLIWWYYARGGGALPPGGDE